MLITVYITFISFSVQVFGSCKDLKKAFKSTNDVSIMGQTYRLLHFLIFQANDLLGHGAGFAPSVYMPDHGWFIFGGDSQKKIGFDSPWEKGPIVEGTGVGDLDQCAVQVFIHL